jgi:hypothetical protein
MTDQNNGPLRRKIQELANQCRKLRALFQERGLGEENTKASLIEPMLEALGWAIRDPDEVFREFRPVPKDNPVDYSLRLMRKPRLLIEAKGLGEDLADRRWISQILGYATMAGAEWCVLTDGDEYRLYNAAATVDADGKLFRQVKLTESSEEEALRVLRLISRSNMEDNLLSILWNAHFVDRRVKDALRSMFDHLHPKLVKLLRKQLPDLAPKVIADSIRRLHISIESLSSPYELPPRAARGSGKGRGEKKGRKGKRSVSVTLADLLAGGYLRAPLPLFRKYKGGRLEATLLTDGKVEFQGTIYDSGSTAAEYARGTVTGRRMNTNGWTFWQYQDDKGNPLCLDDARQRFIKAKSGQ